jgi:hypothetical protein
MNRTPLVQRSHGHLYTVLSSLLFSLLLQDFKVRTDEEDRVIDEASSNSKIN